MASSQVLWNGTPYSTTYASSTQVKVAVAASDLAVAASIAVTVANPAPGGGTSNASAFTVNNPTPAITTLSPASATAGATGFTMAITGTGFVAGSQVRWSGANRTTTYVNPTQLVATIAASDLATAGTAPVIVVNPTPGGGASLAATFTINAAGNSAPVITTISPATASVSDGAFALTVNAAALLPDQRSNGMGRAA